MDGPIRHGKGRPPENALILTTVADERDDAELLFDAMTDLFRGYGRLQALQTRRGLRRRQWIPADAPNVRPAA